MNNFGWFDFCPKTAKATTELAFSKVIYDQHKPGVVTTTGDSSSGSSSSF